MDGQRKSNVTETKSKIKKNGFRKTLFCDDTIKKIGSLRKKGENGERKGENERKYWEKKRKIYRI